MWMFGRVNKDEMKQLKKQDWEIVRELTTQEVDTFVDPKWKGKQDDDDPDDGKFVLIYFDENLSDVCSDILAQNLQIEANKASEMELKRREELEDLRMCNADEAFEEADPIEDLEMEEGQIVEEVGGWNISENRMKRAFYISPMNPEDDCEKATFVVLFKNNSDRIIDMYVNRW